MLINKKNIVFYLFLAVLFISCSKSYNEDFAVGQNEKQNEADKQDKQMENAFATANKIINLKEKENIISYFEREKLPYSEYKGVYIGILKHGNGQKITQSNNVIIEYSYKMLDAQNTNYSKVKTITVNAKGDTQLPYGLIISLQALKQNSQAMVIIPSTLNYTINDEGEKEKSANILICKVKVLKVK